MTDLETETYHDHYTFPKSVQYVLLRLHIWTSNAFIVCWIVVLEHQFFGIRNLQT